MTKILSLKWWDWLLVAMLVAGSCFAIWVKDWNLLKFYLVVVIAAVFVKILTRKGAPR